MATLSDLILDPTTGEYTQTQSFDPIQNQWAWSDQGLQALGGQAETALVDPFLSVQEQYRSGQAIEAATWQDAVMKSLQGFMRTTYGFTDPVINWDTEGSGQMGGSNFRLGTLQELANTLPNFYATGNLVQNVNTGKWEPAGGEGAPYKYDPLLGLDPSTKLLAFEDIPLNELEKVIGNIPGMFLNQQVAAPFQAIVNNTQRQIEELLKKREYIMSQENPSTTMATRWGTITLPGGRGDLRQAREIDAQLTALREQQQAASANIRNNAFMTMDQLKAGGYASDFNDFLFKLNINPYTPKPETIKASPESVLKKFFDTPEYRLMYGNDPNVLNPKLSPTERFRFDPGYNFQIEEGFRGLQNNAAAQGLLESGSTQRDLLKFSQGMADQSYQRFLGQQDSLYNSWQNRMAGLAQMGPQVNGANQAMQQGQSLAGLSGQSSTQLANLLQQLGAGGLGQLGNLGTQGLGAFSNLGQAGLNSLTQAGIAQGNNMTQAAIANAQMQAQQQGQMMGGLGQIAGQVAGSFF